MSNQKDNFYNFASLIWLNQSQLFRNVVNNDSIVTGFFYGEYCQKTHKEKRFYTGYHYPAVQEITIRSVKCGSPYHKSSNKMTPPPYLYNWAFPFQNIQKIQSKTHISCYKMCCQIGFDDLKSPNNIRCTSSIFYALLFCYIYFRVTV